MPRTYLRLATVAAIAGLACAAGPARGAALCSGPPTVTYVDFAPGSAELPQRIAYNHVARLAPLVSPSSKIVSYSILAMGDLAEGEEWEQASPAARKADQVLATARAQALRRMLRRLPSRFRTGYVGTEVRENRQVFTPEQLFAEPGLNDRVRAVVRTWFRYTLPGGIVPAC